MEVDVLVVGGGHNGLVAAAILARHGARVLVCESNPWPGGLAGGLPGGIPDSVFAYALGLVPRSLSDLLGIDRLPLHRPDPSWVVLEDEGVVFRWWRDPGRLAREAEETGLTGLPILLDRLAAFMRCLEARGLLYTPSPPSKWETASLVDDCDPEAAGVAEKSVSGILSEHLPSHAWDMLIWPSMLRANGFALAWYYQNRGVWDQPVGGMASLTRHLYRIALESGARVRLGCRVEEVIVESGRAVGAKLAGGATVEARAVLYTPPIYTLPRLLDPGLLPEADLRALESMRTRRSGVVRIDYIVSRPPSLPVEEGWRGAPIIVYWSHGVGGEYTYPTLGGEERPYHLVRFSGLARDPLEALPPGVEEENLALAWVRGRRDQELCCGNETGHPDHIPMVDPYLYDSRPLPGWGDYTTPVRGLYHGSASSYPGGEVSGVPGVNAALRILVDLGVEPKLSIPVSVKVKKDRVLIGGGGRTRLL